MVILRSQTAVCASAQSGRCPNGTEHSRSFSRAPLNGSSHASFDRPGPTAGQSTFEEIEALGLRCKEGDLAAWSRLFPKIWPVLVTFVHRLYSSFEQQDAEDVAQASIEAAIRGIDTFSGTGLFRAWLFGIAVRQAATFHRSISAKKRGARLVVPLNEVDDHKHEAKSPADVSADNDRSAILHRAIDQLPESDRDLVHLYFFGELTFREIAEARRMNPKTVCTRLTRCKARLLVLVTRFHLTNSNG